MHKKNCQEQLGPDVLGPGKGSLVEDYIRPFDMQKPCTILKVNKPCYWLSGFVYLFLTNSNVCLPQVWHNGSTIYMSKLVSTWFHCVKSFSILLTPHLVTVAYEWQLVIHNLLMNDSKSWGYPCVTISCGFCGKSSDRSEKSASYSPKVYLEFV